MATPIRNVFLKNNFYQLKTHLRAKNYISRNALQLQVQISDTRNVGTKAKYTYSESTASKKGQKISQAMKAYLERTKAYEKVMDEEIAEYEIGKRHLANIMGLDADSFTQEDIDKAISYLLPSGLFDKKARPQMQHPTVSFPPKKAAMFSADGRPYHFQFYTGKQAFYEIMFEAGVKLDRLIELQDCSEETAHRAQIFLAGSKWIDHKDIKNLTQEKVSENDYKRLITILDRITAQPNSSLEKDFIFKFREVLAAAAMPEKKQSEETTGTTSSQTAEGYRKTSVANVTIYRNGSGNFTVNGKYLLDYFPRIIDREQLLFPLQFTGMLGEVDIEATVKEGGCSSQAGAIRLAISSALKEFVDDDVVEKMRLVGLLTRDVRFRERKKFGQKGARAKYTWKRR